MTLQSLLLRALPLPGPGRAFAESEWRTFVSMAEVLVPDVTEVSAEQIADNIERFIIVGRSQRAWRVRALATLVEFSPMALGRKPISQMGVEERRRFVEEHFVEGGGILGVWDICAKIRFLILMGTYGDVRTHARTSYVPASLRRPVTRAETNGVRRAVAS